MSSLSRFGPERVMRAISGAVFGADEADVRLAVDRAAGEVRVGGDVSLSVTADTEPNGCHVAG